MEEDRTPDNYEASGDASPNRMPKEEGDLNQGSIQKKPSSRKRVKHHRLVIWSMLPKPYETAKTKRESELQGKHDREVKKDAIVRQRNMHNPDGFKVIVRCRCVTEEEIADDYILFTEMDNYSMSSHNVIIINIEMDIVDVIDILKEIKIGELKLVDLAGVIQSMTGAMGGRNFGEISMTNFSTKALDNGIPTLVQNQCKKEDRIVPYRDSRLTVQDSLEGNSNTVITANKDPSSCNYPGNLSTLRYGSLVRKIRNKPRVNKNPWDALNRYENDVTSMEVIVALILEETEELKEQQQEIMQNSVCSEDKIIRDKAENLNCLNEKINEIAEEVEQGLGIMKNKLLQLGNMINAGDEEEEAYSVEHVKSDSSSEVDFYELITTYYWGRVPSSESNLPRDPNAGARFLVPTEADRKELSQESTEDECPDRMTERVDSVQQVDRVEYSRMQVMMEYRRNREHYLQREELYWSQQPKQHKEED